MRPVKRGMAPRVFSDHKQAKPYLISFIGSYCSYCESYLRPQDLDVEHIYPQKKHPALKKNWLNFLLACNTCNTYKKVFQGTHRQKGILKSQLWPHLDNTARAFKYESNGEVKVCNKLSTTQRDKAEKTMDMTGLIKSPAVTKTYKELAIAYDGISNRAQIWDMARDELDEFEQHNKCPTKIVKFAGRLGYFSIWMSVFDQHPEVKQQLILKFKADTRCYDVNLNHQTKGRL